MGKFKKSKLSRNQTSEQKSHSHIKTRKQLRKEKRSEKKERKNQHYQKNFLNCTHMNNVKVVTDLKKKTINRNTNSKGSLEETLLTSTELIRSKNKPRSSELQTMNHKNEILMKKKLEKEMNIQRKKTFLEENKDEDKLIRRLEKQLKLKKRKTKTLPKSFTEEGLDYLLDVCDSDKIKLAVEAEKNLQESGSEFEEDFAEVTGKKKNAKDLKTVKNNFSHQEELFDDSDDDDDDDDIMYESNDDHNDISNESNDDDIGCESNDDNNDSEREFSNYIKDSNISKKNSKQSNVSDCGSDFDNCFGDGSESGEESEAKSEEANNKKHKKFYEDIYGRKRDAQGNIVPTSGKYIPPQLKSKLMESSERTELLTRLHRQIKGLLNRLSENNMRGILSQIDQLYMQNSRNDMNETVTKLLFESLIQPVLVPERFTIEHCMLVTALHANVGTEVGAHFLQAIVEKFEVEYVSGVSVANKVVDNILSIIAYLYYFKVFNCGLMFDILKRLTGANNFSEKEVELLLIVLRAVGFNLRKDDPLGLKNLILNIQSQVNSNTDLSKQSRVRFMMDVLTAIKNNNTSKIPNYDASEIEHHRKILRSLIQKGKYISELNITLNDLLNAQHLGRWWVVGSAWTGGVLEKSHSLKSNADSDETNTDSVYLELAKKHRMTTDIRRNIFCVLMSAEDYMDAFEKLLKLGLKGPQEQTIIHIVVHCLLQEKTFNPYYAHLAVQFCSTDRKYQMTLQYHLWDRIRELSNMKGFQITNIALFLAHLFIEKALPLSVLKVVEFTSLSKPHVRLLRRVFLTLLLHKNNEAVTEAFQKLSRSPKLQMFRESIRLFFHHFILKNISENSDQMALLKERVKIAEKLLNLS